MSQFGSAHIDLNMNSRQLEAKSKSVMRVMDKVKLKFQSVARVARNMMIGSGLAIGLFVRAASRLEETTSKFQAVFKEEADAADAWATRTAAAINRSKGSLLSYLATLQDTFVPLGFARKEARGLSQDMVALAEDLASFNNLRTEDVMQSLISGMLGMHRSLLKFGVVINSAILDQELFKMGIKGGSDAATVQQKTLARLAIITRTTADAQGDAERTAGSFENQMKALSASLLTLQEELGKVFIPILIDMAKWIRLNAKVAAEWVKTHQDTILTTVKWAMGLGIVLIILPKLISGIMGVISAVQALSAAMVAMNLVAAASPIGLIAIGAAAILAGLAAVAGAIYLINDALIAGQKEAEKFDKLLGGFEDRISKIQQHLKDPEGKATEKAKQLEFRNKGKDTLEGRRFIELKRTKKLLEEIAAEKAKIDKAIAKPVQPNLLALGFSPQAAILAAAKKKHDQVVEQQKALAILEKQRAEVQAMNSALTTQQRKLNAARNASEAIKKAWEKVKETTATWWENVKKANEPIPLSKEELALLAEADDKIRSIEENIARLQGTPEIALEEARLKHQGFSTKSIEKIIALRKKEEALIKRKAELEKRQLDKKTLLEKIRLGIELLKQEKERLEFLLKREIISGKELRAAKAIAKENKKSVDLKFRSGMESLEGLANRLGVAASAGSIIGLRSKVVPAHKLTAADAVKNLIRQSMKDSADLRKQGEDAKLELKDERKKQEKWREEWRDVNTVGKAQPGFGP